MNRLQGVLAGLTAVLIWAACPSAIKISLGDVSVPSFLITRYGIASLALIFLTRKVLAKMKKLPVKLWIATFLAAATHNGTQALCLTEVPVIWYVIFFCFSPIVTLFFIESEDKPQGLHFWFILAFIGSMIFLNPENVNGYPSISAIFYLFLCVISWIVLMILMTHLQKIYKDFEVAYIINMSNLISAIFIFAFAGAKYTLDFKQSILPIGIIAISLSFAMVFFSISLRKTPFFSIASQYLELVFGVAIGYYIFRDKPTTYQYIGSSLIVIALIGTTLSNDIKLSIKQRIVRIFRRHNDLTKLNINTD